MNNLKRILCFLAAAVTLLVACVCTSSCTSLFSGNEKGVYSFSVENVAYVATDSRRVATF